MKIQQFISLRHVLRLVFLVPVTLFVACGGGGGGGGTNSPPSSPPPPTVVAYNVTLETQEVLGGSNETGTATAIVRHNTTDGQIEATVTLTGVTADGVSLRRGFGGEAGTEMFALTQGSSATEWTLASQSFSSANAADLRAGAIHIVVATAALPDGALRGQVLPAGMELVTTTLTGNAVVMSGIASKAAAPAGSLMTTLSADEFTAHLNLLSIADATAVELRQAPAGQNGPVVATFAQDINDPRHWALANQSIDGLLGAGLDNQTLYVNVATPASPGGVARGQIETSASQTPSDPSVFSVISTDPMNASVLNALPQTVFFTLSREPLAVSVSPRAVLVEESGMDGSFGDGNEVTITPASVVANGNTIEVSLAGVVASDDVYRVSLLGGGVDGVVDTSGIPLDGNGDGEPGGTFESAFEVDTPSVVATLVKIQDEIFTPSCATSGCHSGSNPPDGLHLTAGDSFSNIVNVNSVQMPALKRIKPGDPDQSYLIRKVKGAGIVANRMPLGAAPLSQAQIDLLTQWVQEGANDN